MQLANLFNMARKTLFDKIRTDKRFIEYKETLKNFLQKAETNNICKTAPVSGAVF